MPAIIYPDDMFWENFLFLSMNTLCLKIRFDLAIYEESVK